VGLEHEDKNKLRSASTSFVSIPPSGLGTEFEVKYGLDQDMSPSHAVGLEPGLTSGKYYGYIYKLSPSHTVGLEHEDKNKLRSASTSFVSIPPSGLGTVELGILMDALLVASPSHPVGLERDREK
jgi:hypothetical protein